MRTSRVIIQDALEVRLRMLIPFVDKWPQVMFYCLWCTVITSGYNWRAPCKPAPNDCFVAIFQVALNWLKFGMSTLFVSRNVPVVFFFKNAETYGQNCVKFKPPPPPPLSLCSSPSNDLGKSLRNSHLGPACTEPFNSFNMNINQEADSIKGRLIGCLISLVD